MAGEPKRIQRKRTKGWRMPEGAIYVGRPTRWGNPAQVGRPHPHALPGDPDQRPLTAQEAVDIFRCCHFSAERLAPLRGKDLACWCPLDQPCHADVLLELANRESADG